MSSLWLKFLLLLSMVCGGCRIEDRFIFHPERVINRNPSQIGLAFEDVFFTTKDGLKLHGWFIPHQESRATLVWFHGNAGNISDRLLNIKLLHDHIKSDILIFDYRGYGRSEGSVSEEGTYLDGEAAIQYLRGRRNTGARQLVLFGRSLGAAVAAEMAIRFNSSGLILESPFVSIREMASAIFPALPIGFLLRTRYDVIEKVRNLKVPLLVLHGDRDEVVPFAQGKKYSTSPRNPKHFTGSWERRITIRSLSAAKSTSELYGSSLKARLLPQVESSHQVKGKPLFTREDHSLIRCTPGAAGS